jgi:hypothetical protein
MIFVKHISDTYCADQFHNHSTHPKQDLCPFLSSKKKNYKPGNQEIGSARAQCSLPICADGKLCACAA